MPIHNRKAIRLKGYDYSRNGMYYVTICTQNRECIFGKIEDNKMIVNQYGKILESVWLELPRHYANVVLREHVVMPDHIHAIIEIDNNANGCNTVGDGLKPFYDAQPRQHGLPEIVRALKTFSARKINELRNTQGVSVWQRNYYEHIIRNDEEYCNIAIYINENPMNWNTRD